MTDEEFLYQCFCNFEEETRRKAKKRANAKVYKKDLASIKTNAQLVLMRLENESTSIIEVRKNVLSGKHMFIRFVGISEIMPEHVTDSMKKTMDKLIHEVCRREAEMIDLVRMRELGGERIDITEIFSYNKYLPRLKGELAQDIVADAVKDADIVFGPSYYITATGTKYHQENCPYCRGRQLSAVSKKIVEMQKLTPCKCVALQEKLQGVDHSCVTAFVDESIHETKWDENGKKGRDGSFSYIICWGDLKNESEITPENVITQGVDYSTEHQNIERITESAIGKVLITLAYDYEFHGPVQVFTDNQHASVNWMDNRRNKKLVKLFHHVAVSYIPRELNTKADSLGRTRRHLDIPKEHYDELVNFAEEVNQLQKQVHRLEKKTLLQKEKIQKLSTELEESKAIIAAYKPSIWERISEFIKGKFAWIRSGQVLVDNFDPQVDLPREH